MSDFFRKIQKSLSAYLAELRIGYSYCKDPTGWEARIWIAERMRYADRPAIYRVDEKYVVHPALRNTVAGKIADAVGIFGNYGVDILYSQYAVKHAPAGGWPDVVVPERPRLRP